MSVASKTMFVTETKTETDFKTALRQIIVHFMTKHGLDSSETLSEALGLSHMATDRLISSNWTVTEMLKMVDTLKIPVEITVSEVA